jgi:hypothetical protein
VIVQVHDTVVATPDDILTGVSNERGQKRPFVPMLLSEPGSLRWVSFPLNRATGGPIEPGNDDENGR